MYCVVPSPSKLTAKGFQDSSSFVAFFIKGRRPESFGSDLVGKFIDWRTELLEVSPALIEGCLSAGFKFVHCDNCLPNEIDDDVGW